MNKGFGRALGILFTIVVIFSLVAGTQSQAYKARQAEKELVRQLEMATWTTYTIAYQVDWESFKNPFFLGQIVYPAPDFHLTMPTSELLAMANDGAEVIDMTDELIRVRFNDGSEAVYGSAWFRPGSVETNSVTEPYTGYSWLVGNTFVVGQEICAIPDSVREDFPDQTVVLEIDEQNELLRIAGHEGLVNYARFQKCVK